MDWAYVVQNHRLPRDKLGGGLTCIYPETCRSLDTRHLFLERCLPMKRRLSFSAVSDDLTLGERPVGVVAPTQAGRSETGRARLGV